MDDELQDAIQKWDHIPKFKSGQPCTECGDDLDVIIGGLRYVPEDKKYLYRSYLLACLKCSSSFIVMFFRESNN